MKTNREKSQEEQRIIMRKIMNKIDEAIQLGQIALAETSTDREKNEEK